MHLGEWLSTLDWNDISGQVIAAVVATAVLAFIGLLTRPWRALQRWANARGPSEERSFSVAPMDVIGRHVLLINRSEDPALGVRVEFDDPERVALWGPDWRAKAVDIAPGTGKPMRVEGISIMDGFTVTWRTRSRRKHFQELRLP